ncbi:MAG: glycosyltransferase family 2 protein [Sandarakinorhabdus sp.]|nr:glycosyltransferase family 2 protein [Sandarakinorhabdus sp.]
MRRLGVVIVNWNRCGFTIECLESLMRSDVPLQVVVVDNGSTDGSIAGLVDWSTGCTPSSPPDHPLGSLITPPLGTPVALTITPATVLPTPGYISVIDAGGNLGFAGGNNIGLAHLARDPDLTHFWLLNNDTVVAPDAAGALLRCFEADPAIGMCGTVVRFYSRPDVVQALNGYRFSKISGAATPIGGSLHLPPGAQLPQTPTEIAAQTDFVLGASLAVSRAFVDQIGPMSEDYFLYFEEIDWATRNAGRFKTGFAADASVWHKAGGSIGSGEGHGTRGPGSDYYMTRARLLFTRNHYPWLLPLHYLQGLVIAARRRLRGQPSNARSILRALLGAPLSG